MLQKSFLQKDEYIRQRLESRLIDNHYLRLSELRLALEEFKTAERLLILDVGCGGSPYHALFPNANYKRADINTASNIDYQINQDSKVN